MIAALAWIGFVCVSVVAASLAYVIVSYLVWFAVVKTSATVRCLRRLWRFYKSLPSGRLTKQGRYFIAVYDKDTGGFSHVQALDSRFYTEEELKAEREKVRQRLTRKGGVHFDAS
jgi:hypothetical protein